MAGIWLELARRFVMRIVLVFQQQITQVACAGFRVLGGIMRIHIQLGGRLWHQLHQPDGAFGRYRVFPIARFGPRDAMHDRGRQTGVKGRLCDKFLGRKFDVSSRCR